LTYQNKNSLTNIVNGFQLNSNLPTGGGSHGE